MTDDLVQLRKRLRALCDRERANTDHLAFCRSYFDLAVTHLMLHREKLSPLVTGKAVIVYQTEQELRDAAHVPE